MRIIKNSIIKYLSDKKNFYEYDKMLIHDLTKVKEIALKCEKAIKNGEPFSGKTLKEDIELYLKCVQIIKDSYSKLGITPQERVKLKLEEAKATEKISRLSEMRNENDEDDDI